MLSAIVIIRVDGDRMVYSSSGDRMVYSSSGDRMVYSNIHIRAAYVYSLRVKGFSLTLQKFLLHAHWKEGPLVVMSIEIWADRWPEWFAFSWNQLSKHSVQIFYTNVVLPDFFWFRGRVVRHLVDIWGLLLTQIKRHQHTSLTVYPPLLPVFLSLLNKWHIRDVMMNLMLYIIPAMLSPIIVSSSSL